MSCKIFKSLFSSSLNLSIAESNLLLFNFDFFIARIFIWFCLISSRLTVSCIFSVFSKSFFIFLKHIKPSYLISCVWLFQYQFFIALVCYLFCLPAFTHCFLLGVIIFDCGLTYLRTLSLRVFFESVPKISFSTVNVLFLQSFWK